MAGIPGDEVTIYAILDDEENDEENTNPRVAATSNDFTYRNDYFSLDLGDCVLNPARNKLLQAGVILVNGNETTVRVEVTDFFASGPMSDGFLYSCTFGIMGGTPLGSHPLANENESALDESSLPLSPVAGADGEIVVVAPTSTPTLTLTVTPVPTPTTGGFLMSLGPLPTAIPTTTVTQTRTITPTPLPTSTVTRTRTFTPTPLPSATWTTKPTNTRTPTRTITRTPTITLTPIKDEIELLQHRHVDEIILGPWTINEGD
jgi:hypothetical protein